MTIAVTGAAGFVGTHLLRSLMACGEEVVGVVRRRPATPVAGVRYLELDLTATGPDTYRAIGTPHTLVHLAWGGLPNYLARHHFECELPLHYRFLREMVEAGLPGLVVTGTCYEYGMVDGELDEAMEPRPANPYAYAKTALLRQLRFLQEDHAFAFTWARLFYMWGEGQARSSLYPLLQAAIARGDPEFPMSMGEQLRDYLPVETVADLLAALALRGGGDGIVNISSGRPVSVRSLVENWIARSGSTIMPARGRYPYPTYEPFAFWGSAARRQALPGLGQD